MSIFIDFLALVAVAYVLSVAWRYLRRTRWRRLALVAFGAIAVVAAFDQTGNSIVPNYTSIRTTFLRDAEFTSQVEASLPTGAAVYQLPYRRYPEAGTIGHVADYEPLRPYLQSKTLRFSYGGEKGREAGWQSYVFDRPGAKVLPLLCLAGFSAIWIDRESMSAGGGPQVEAEMSSVLAEQPMVDPTQRFAVYDIRPYCLEAEAGVEPATADRLRDELLRPLWTHWSHGSQPARTAPDGTVLRDMRVPTDVSIVNAGDAGREVTVAFDVATISPTSGSVEIQWPDGTTQSAPAGAHVERTVTLPAGESRVGFRAPVGSPVNAVQITGFYAIDPDLLGLAR